MRGIRHGRRSGWRVLGAAMVVALLGGILVATPGVAGAVPYADGTYAMNSYIDYGTSPDWQDPDHTVYVALPNIYGNTPIYTRFVSNGRHSSTTDSLVDGEVTSTSMTVSGIPGATIGRSGNGQLLLQCRDASGAADYCEIAEDHYVLRFEWEGVAKDRSCVQGPRPSECGDVLIGGSVTRTVVVGEAPVDEPQIAAEVTADVDGDVRIGDQVPISVTVSNPDDEALTNVSLGGGSGLRFDGEELSLVSGPDQQLPTVLSPGQQAVLHYVVEPIASGNLEIAVTASATADGETVSADASTALNVAPALSMSLATSVTSATKVGDEFTATATITNLGSVAVTDVRLEPLVTDPTSSVSPVSGPTGPTGTDPRVDPITVPAEGTATVTWVYRAVERGTVDLTARASGRNPRDGSLFFISAETDLAIEAPGLAISDFRMQPGTPTPGQFGNLRGTVTNIGTVAVTGIDFAKESNPRTVIMEQRMAESGASPRIDRLEPGESREFLIPFGMVLDVQDFGAYTVDLEMSGTATVDGEPVAVSAVAKAAGPLDLSRYWTTIYDEIGRQLRSGFFAFFEGVNDWGDSSTLGGVAVGSTEGVLTMLQKMGDGLLTTGELIATEDGHARLTATGQMLVAQIREYRETATMKQFLIDFANVRDDATVGAVGIFADWMFEVESAADEGDYRKVSALLTESGAQFATGVGVEKAAAQLFTRAVETAAARKLLSYLKRAPDVPVEGPGVPDPDYVKIVDAEYAELTDIPVGVPLSGETVARAGLTLDEHAWMIEMAKEHGVSFMVRPRPADAAKYAELGYNAKPMPIKFKSVNDIDAQWLGMEDYADSKGVVVLREPKDPFDEIFRAVDRGELSDAEVDKISDRYFLRKAEWEQSDEILDELNDQNGGEGFDIRRYGRTIRTRVERDPSDGLLRMTWNDKPVFSDIDLLAIANPDGSPIDPALHKQITEAGGFGIDGQHGDSAMTSDFPNWKVAEKVAVPYIYEHQRGGEPLVIVQPDVTTLGYVDQITLPEVAPTGSGYDLYGAVRITVEGGGSR